MDSKTLQDELFSLSEWRKKELSQARSLAETATSEDAKRYLARAWVLIMYAHCDNFLTKATEFYLDYAKYNHLNNYKPELIWLLVNGKNIKGMIEANVKYKSPKDCLTDKIELIGGSKNFINEKSFSYATLRFFCDWVLQIEYAHLEMQAFCKTLAEKRNAIAHGEEAYIEKVDDCLEWHNKTIEFMDSLTTSIINSTSITNAI